jgi:hypothetical protein
MQTSASTTLDANVFATLSPGWLEALEGEDLQALELELEELVEKQSGIQAAEHGAINDRCSQDPLYWLQNFTATDNPKHAQQGLPYRAPFPKKSYFAPLFGAFRSESRLFIPKTREMLTSWCVMGDSAHRSQWMRWEVIVQTGSEDKAHELIDYAGQLYKNQPDWLRQLHPLDGPPSKSEVRWASGGRILAIPSGVNKIRLYHPTRYVMDEAAFLPEAEQCYNAANPVAQQIIAISSAGPGWFGDQCTR